MKIDRWRKRKLLVLFYLRRKNRRNIKTRGERTIWVRPTISLKERKLNSIHYNLTEKQKIEEEKSYRNYFRISPDDFDELLEGIRVPIEKYANREPITPEEKLALTLRYLASGYAMHSVANNYRMGVSTVSIIIRETCTAIWDVLSKKVFPELDADLWKEVAKEFNNKWDMPHCIGAIDGKHVMMQAPPNSGSDFYNYKHQHSLVLMAICDANYKFLYVNMGAQGRQSDGGVFRKTDFYKKLKDKTLNIPPPETIEDDMMYTTPYYFVADEAFPLGENIMRPFPGHFLEIQKRVFNYRLSRARRTIENAFGILVSRWRILRHPIIASLITVEKITLACICLHNWLMIKTKNENYSARLENDNIRQTDGQLIDIAGRNNIYMNRSAVDIRHRLAEYFLERGAVPFQWDK